jgi:DNA-directed RNA polymerase specialized sigma24 family protein
MGTLRRLRRAGTIPSSPSRHEATFAQIVAHYDQLQRQLASYFRARHCPVDELVAETLFRLTVKAADDIEIENLFGYASGIARHVYADWLTAKRAATPIGDDLWIAPAHRPASCFQRCLAQLRPDERELLEAYYLDPHRDRTHLLATAGISRNALRVRICRLKDRVRVCMARCRARERGSTKQE